MSETNEEQEAISSPKNPSSLAESKSFWNLQFETGDLTEFSDEKARQEILAGNALEKIRCKRIDLRALTLEKPVVLKNCLIEELFFEGAVFLKAVTLLNCEIEKVAAKSCIFEEVVQIEKTSFLQGVALDASSFKDNAIFEQSLFTKKFSCRFANFEAKAQFNVFFHGACDFKKTFFKGESYFNQLYFSEQASFELANFALDTGFRRSHFQGKANFRSATFGGKTYFQEAVFQELAKFSNAHFRGNTFFIESKFKGKGEFDNVRTSESLNFTKSEFLAEANFARGSYREDMVFQDVTFHKPLDLERSVFATRLDFRGAQFVEIILSGVLANLIVAQHEQFIGKLKAENENHALQAKEEFNILQANFERLGDHTSSEWAYYHFRRQERIAIKSARLDVLFLKFLNWFIFDLCCGYGTKPLRLLGLGLGVVFFFSLLYFFIPGTLEAPTGSSLTFFQSFYYSLMVFSTMGSEQIYPKLDSIFKFVVSLEACLGIFLMTLFVGTCTRKIAH